MENVVRDSQRGSPSLSLSPFSEVVMAIFFFMQYFTRRWLKKYDTFNLLLFHTKFTIAFAINKIF